MDKSVIHVYDRVKTKTGRQGVVKAITHKDVAHVVWDEPNLEFPIRVCHLEMVERGSLLPTWYYMKEDKPTGQSN